MIITPGQLLTLDTHDPTWIVRILVLSIERTVNGVHSFVTCIVYRHDEMNDPIKSVGIETDYYIDHSTWLV